MRRNQFKICNLRHAIFSFFIFFSFLHIVFANDGYIGSIGQTAFPLQNSDIVMEREKIMIEDLGEDAEEAVVECTFWFKNTKDSAVTVDIGFPEEQVGEQDFSYYQIRDFKTWVDGAPAGVDVKDAVDSQDVPHFGDYRRWFTWKVTFKAGETRILKNTYRIHEGANNYGGWDYRYVLKTGALWAGKVGKAEIVFKSPRFPFSAEDLSQSAYVKFLKGHLLSESKKSEPWFLVHLTPANWTIENGAVKWTFVNFEPNEDIVIAHTGFPEFYEKILKSLPKTKVSKDALLSRIAGSPVAASGDERMDALKQFIKWYPQEKNTQEILLGYAVAYQQLGDNEDNPPPGYYKNAAAYFGKLFTRHAKWKNISRAYVYAGHFYLNSMKDEKKSVRSFRSAISSCKTRASCYAAWSGLVSAYRQFEKWKELKSACGEFSAWAQKNDYKVNWLQDTLAEANKHL